jgi:hypothetical protein
MMKRRDFLLTAAGAALSTIIVDQKETAARPPLQEMSIDPLPRWMKYYSVALYTIPQTTDEAREIAFSLDKNSNDVPYKKLLTGKLTPQEFYQTLATCALACPDRMALKRNEAYLRGEASSSTPSFFLDVQKAVLEIGWLERYENGNPSLVVAHAPVVVGKTKTPTPKGVFQVYNIDRNPSEKYAEKSFYWDFAVAADNTIFALHAWFEQRYNQGVFRGAASASLGCIRLPFDVAKLFEQIIPRDTYIIIGQAPDAVRQMMSFPKDAGR